MYIYEVDTKLNERIFSLSNSILATKQKGESFKSAKNTFQRSSDEPESGLDEYMQWDREDILVTGYSNEYYNYFYDIFQPSCSTCGPDPIIPTEPDPTQNYPPCYFEPYGCGGPPTDDNGSGGNIPIEEEPDSIVKPHCSSFEYAKPPGANYSGCGVIGMHNTFYTLTANLDIKSVYVAFDTMYFWMPLSMPNGIAATKTAEAIERAFETTENWYADNPNALEIQVQLHISAEIKKEMRSIGGEASTNTSPFPIPNPAQYVTNLLMTGNCN